MKSDFFLDFILAIFCDTKQRYPCAQGQNPAVLSPSWNLANQWSSTLFGIYMKTGLVHINRKNTRNSSVLLSLLLLTPVAYYTCSLSPVGKERILRNPQKRILSSGSEQTKVPTRQPLFTSWSTWEESVTACLSYRIVSPEVKHWNALWKHLGWLQLSSSWSQPAGPWAICCHQMSKSILSTGALQFSDRSDRMTFWLPQCTSEVIPVKESQQWF